MNVKGPGHPPDPGVAGPETQSGPVAADKAQKGDKKGDKIGDLAGSGETRPSSFAQKASDARPPQVASVATPSRPGDVAVGDLAGELRAGKVSAHAAIDKLLERVVARQVGPDAPSEIRDQIRAALQEALETDPLLAEKLRQLS